METKKFKFNDRAAATLLINGEIIAFPTETVFGLGCRYDNFQAFEKLVAVKKRNPSKPFTLMGGNNFDIGSIADVDERTQRLINLFFPGPLTIILKLKSSVPRWVTLGTDYIGYRVSGDLRVRNLIDDVGVPLLVPSCNEEGKAPCVDENEVIKCFNGQIAGVIQGSIDGGGTPSTIVKISDTGIELIRQGELDFAILKRIWEE